MRSTPWLAALALALCLADGGQPAFAQDRGSEAGHTPPKHARSVRAASAHRKPLHHRVQTGKASFYSPELAGHRMADGTPMNPQANIAASKTLPLGSKARVTNVKTGQSTVVEIRDRGPYVGGRILDVSPAAASQLGMKHSGVASVKVQPIAPAASTDSKESTAPAASRP